MRKYWPLLAIVVILAAIVGVSQYAETAKQHCEESAQKAKAAAVAKGGDGKANNNAEDACKPPVWARYFAWPEGVGAWAVILTLLAIVWQSAETRSAAEATLSGVEAQMDASRGWVMGTLENIPEWNPDPMRAEFMDIAPIFRNYGDTPGTVMNILMRGQYLKDDEELPNEPVYKGTKLWENRGFTGQIDVMPKTIVQPIVLKVSGMEFHAVKKGLQRHFIYWVVNYNDVHGRKWHSRSCYLYHVPSGFDSMSEGYYIAGPSDYNRSGQGYYEGQNPN